MSDLVADFIDAPYSSLEPQVWTRNINTTLVVSPDELSVPLVFPQQNPGVYLDFSLDYSQWLENDDFLVSGSVSVSPSSLTMNFSFLETPYLTSWVSGGVSGTIYAITYSIQTQEGRAIQETAWLPCEEFTPEPPIQ